MNLFTILPVNTNDNSLPQLNAADITTFGTAEYGAAGHWLLGGSTASLTGITASKSLLAENTTAPIWNENSVTLNGYPAGLISPSTDSATATDSFCMVFKTPATLASDVILGNATSTVADGGFFVGLTSGGEIYFTARSSVTNVPLFDNETMATGLVANTWYFVSVSRDFSASDKILNYKVSTIGTGQATGVLGYDDASNNIACGNGYLNNANRPVQYAEFISYERTISSDEMSAIYLRSKDRMASKGISLA